MLALHTQQPLQGLPETSPMQVAHTQIRWTRLTWLPRTTHHQWHQSGCKANRTALPPLKQNRCIGHLRDMITDHDMFIIEMYRRISYVGLEDELMCLSSSRNLLESLMSADTSPQNFHWILMNVHRFSSLSVFWYIYIYSSCVLLS